jgi:hypothetical protein
MSKIFDFKNPLNFSLVYTNNLAATPIRENGVIVDYLPITEIIIPIIFNKPIVAINIKTSVPVGRIWQYAGKASRIFDFALGEGFSADERKFLFLNRWNLVLFDRVLPNDYRVVYLPPRWFIDVNISVYQYDGVYEDTLENDVSTIKDFLFNNQG